MEQVEHAVAEALRHRRRDRDERAEYLYPDEPFTPPAFGLDGREHLQGIHVAAPDLSACRVLLGGQKMEAAPHGSAYLIITLDA